MDSEGGHMFPNGVSVHRLGQHIGRVVGAWPHNELEVPGSNSLLNPYFGQRPDGAPARCLRVGKCQ
eukprot:15047405-Alexandrium_andersonii.AAC.1